MLISLLVYSTVLHDLWSVGRPGIGSSYIMKIFTSVVLPIRADCRAPKPFQHTRQNRGQSGQMRMRKRTIQKKKEGADLPPPPPPSLSLPPSLPPSPLSSFSVLTVSVQKTDSHAFLPGLFITLISL